jgi:hypothetical protein
VVGVDVIGHFALELGRFQHQRQILGLAAQLDDVAFLDEIDGC